MIFQFRINIELKLYTSIVYLKECVYKNIRSISSEQLLFHNLQFSLCVQNNVPANHFPRISETTERRLCTRMLLHLLTGSFARCMTAGWWSKQHEWIKFEYHQFSSMDFLPLLRYNSFTTIGHYCFTLPQSRVGGDAICWNRDGMPVCCCFKQSIVFDEMLMLNDFIPFVSTQWW